MFVSLVVMHSSRMRALDRHWWAKLLLLQSSVNGFATAFGRPAQALCLKPSFLTCKTRYCHGLRSRVASWPLANCFIYRITAFGRVNCFLLLTVTSSSTLQQNCEPSYRIGISAEMCIRLNEALVRKIGWANSVID